MSKENKFWLCVFTICILGVSVCAYSESRKSASQDKPVYELKSDIINFDYTKLSYPSNSVSVGIKTNETLKERKPGQPTGDIRFNDIIGGIKIFFVFLLTLVTMYGTFGFLPNCIVYYTLLLRRKRIERKKEKEKPLYSEINSSGGTISDTIVGTPV